MLCVMVIDNDCYAYFSKFINCQLLRLLFILCTWTLCYVSIGCSVVLLVYTYYNNDKTLIIKRGHKVPHNFFCLL
eukprot:UN02233